MVRGTWVSTLGKRIVKSCLEPHHFLLGVHSAPKLFPDASSYTLVSDPDRKIYAAWGIGLLGWTGMVNGSVMNSLKSLKASEGIDLRTTGKGSFRWQNSGGFAVDAKGIARWRKIAKESSDMCDYAAAAKTIE